MLNRLTDSLNFNSQALVLRAARQQVLASNIANADTPGYLSRDFNFAQMLREATSVSQTAGEPASTELDNGAASIQERIQRSLIYSLPSQTSLDSNTVDMNRERASFAENALKYESTLRFVSGQVRTMLDAIKGNGSP